MAHSRTGAISWYSPDPRAIIPFRAFVPSRSLRQTLRKNIYRITINSAFEKVIRSCSEREETWISNDMIRAYTELHTKGFAHSVEAWCDAQLVGGLYGVALGGAFFGESMFSRQPDSSKVAFVHLVERLKARRFLLLDTQFINDHVRQFGAVEIPRSRYLALLSEALRANTSFL